MENIQAEASMIGSGGWVFIWKMILYFKIPIITELSMKKMAGCVVKKWVTALKIDELTEFIDQLSKSSWSVGWTLDLELVTLELLLDVIAVNKRITKTEKLFSLLRTEHSIDESYL